MLHAAINILFWASNCYSWNYLHSSFMSEQKHRGIHLDGIQLLVGGEFFMRRSSPAREHHWWNQVVGHLNTAGSEDLELVNESSLGLLAVCVLKCCCRHSPWIRNSPGVGRRAEGFSVAAGADHSPKKRHDPDRFLRDLTMTPSVSGDIPVVVKFTFLECGTTVLHGLPAVHSFSKQRDRYNSSTAIFLEDLI